MKSLLVVLLLSVVGMEGSLSDKRVRRQMWGPPPNIGQFWPGHTHEHSSEEGFFNGPEEPWMQSAIFDSPEVNQNNFGGNFGVNQNIWPNQNQNWGQSQSQSNQNSNGRPNQGQMNRPNQNQNNRPSQNQNNRPNQNQNNRPNQNQNNRPNQNQNNRPNQNQNNRPNQNQNNRPNQNQNNRPNQDQNRRTTTESGGPLSTTPTTIHYAPKGCTCPVTQQFNPVCGTDGNTYKNAGLLSCYQRCGSSVSQRRLGAC